MNNFKQRGILFILGILILVIGMVSTGCSQKPAVSNQQNETQSTQSDATSKDKENMAKEETPKEDVSAFYKGNSIDLIVPYKPGGGYDEYARMIAPFLQKHTGANVVIKNIEGAGGMRGVNELYRSPKDGLTIGIINGSAAVTNVLAEIEGVVYELEKFSWIGRIVADPRVLTVAVDSPYNTIEDILNSPNNVILGATGLGGSTYVDAVIVGEALGMPIEVVHGFDSSSVVEQAILRGDVTGMWGSWDSRRSSIESGLAKVVLQGGEERLADLPDIPTWFEMAKTERAKSILTVLESLASIGRPIAAPPGVSEERLAFLQEAFKNVMEDPELLAQALEYERGLDYASGDKIGQMAVNAVSMPEDIKAIFVKAIRGDL
jgi:tripartite-type tricarboxylate transporter receptor subunit TctC